MRTSIAVLCGAIFIVASCGGRSIPVPQEVAIPPKLSSQNVEIAILSALLNHPPPGIYKPREEMPKEQYDQLVWSYYVTSAGNRGWVVESRDPGRIVAIISRAKYHLRVQVQYDDRQVKTSIVDSSGLDQKDGRIHRKAVGWIVKLEQRIRAELQRLALI